MAAWTSIFMKDMKAELRQPQFILGVLFFQFCLLFLFFLFQESTLPPSWWGNLFWINLLIAAMTLVLKNFNAETSGQYSYYYQLTDATTIYLSKAFYNFILLSIAAVLNFLLFYLFFDPMKFDLWKILVLVVLGVMGMSLSLTLIAFIAGFGQNASLLINILVLPIIIPLFLLLIRSTILGAQGLYFTWSGDVALIGGIILLTLGLGLGLFPYLWRR